MRILIDPGHGGESTGTLEGFLPEKEMNLYVAKGLKERLEGDFEVMLTREGDTYLSLRDRVEMCKGFNPYVFLSVHHNAYEEEVEPRTEVYTGWEVVSPSYDLAYTVLENVKKRFPKRRVLPPLPSRYTVMGCNAPVKLLTELFFASEVNRGLLEEEIEILSLSLREFLRKPPVESPEPLWSFGGYSHFPGFRTVKSGLDPEFPHGEDRAVVLLDGRVFWYALYASRSLGARYVHSGMTVQKDRVHVALELGDFSGTLLLLDYGDPLITYYHTDGEGEEISRRLAESLGYPLKPGSDYLLIHPLGARVKVVSDWKSPLEILRTIRKTLS